jgi:hypothetical protein
MMNSLVYNTKGLHQPLQNIDNIIDNDVVNNVVNVIMHNLVDITANIESPTPGAGRRLHSARLHSTVADLDH